VAYIACWWFAIYFGSDWMQDNYEGRECYYDDNPCMEGLSLCVVDGKHVIKEGEEGVCRFVGYHILCALLALQFFVRTVFLPLLRHKIMNGKGRQRTYGVGPAMAKMGLWAALWGWSWAMFDFRILPAGLTHAWYWLGWELLFRIVPVWVWAEATPLHKASWNGDAKAVEQLLAEGHNPYAVTCANYSAQDMAVFSSMRKSVSAEQANNCYYILSAATACCGCAQAKLSSVCPERSSADKGKPSAV